MQNAMFCQIPATHRRENDIAWSIENMKSRPDKSKFDVYVNYLISSARVLGMNTYYC